MKKNIAILLSLALTIAFAACSGDDELLTPAATTQTDNGTVIFELTATHPANDGNATTRAVKQDWEAGDAIFVFFSNVAAPKHLKMTYDGTAWTSTKYDGAKTRVADGQRCDFFAPGKTLASYSAVRLPDNSDEYAPYQSVFEPYNENGRWIPVGPDKTVKFWQGGTWYTCNYGQSVPEARGNCYTSAPGGVTIPSESEASFLVNSCSHVWLSVHGICGIVCSSGNRFIFLPSRNQFSADYIAAGISFNIDKNFGIELCASLGDRFVRGVKR